MRLLRLAAMILAIVGGYLALPGGSASAAPIGAGALPFAQSAGNPLVSKAQWGYRRGYYRPYRAYGYRPYRRYGYGYGYGYRRPVYGYGGPRLVCRWRPSPWGPRRVCFRRW